jgi:hypothetical protein
MVEQRLERVGCLASVGFEEAVDAGRIERCRARVVVECRLGDGEKLDAVDEAADEPYYAGCLAVGERADKLELGDIRRHVEANGSR